jgi:hypothetical protein
MTELIAEEVLVVAHVGSVPEGSERPFVLRQDVSHASGDQDPNQMVVERPPRLVASRQCETDGAH